tara:strand:- start:194 stop:634 length:441 start_codon:yes stop_codon:yes gene_type:complete
MIRVKIKKKPIIKLVNKKIAKMLNDIADMTAGQLKTDLYKSRDIDGKKLKPLKAKTIARKRKKGLKHPNKPLIGTGLMGNIFRSKTASASSLVSEIKTSDKRKEVAVYHLEGAGNLPLRRWIGIGRKSERRINRYLKSRIKGVLKP